METLASVFRIPRLFAIDPPDVPCPSHVSPPQLRDLNAIGIKLKYVLILKEGDHAETLKQLRDCTSCLLRRLHCPCLTWRSCDLFQGIFGGRWLYV